MNSGTALKPSLLIIADFLGDEEIVATVSGRMGSGTFDFNINNLKTKSPCTVAVNNSQIEIDAAYEGIRVLALFEAKRDLSDDCLAWAFSVLMGGARFSQNGHLQRNSC